MTSKQQNQKKSVTNFTNDNILESLRGVGGNVVKTSADTATKISSDVLTSLFGALPKSGELKANEPIDIRTEQEAVPVVARRPDILSPRTDIAELNLKQQIEAVRVTMSRKLRKEGTFFLRLFPDKPVTKKPAETRMGKGKGAPELWVAVVKRGRIFCEVAGVTEEQAREVFGLIKSKLPMRTKFVKKEQEATV